MGSLFSKTDGFHWTNPNYCMCCSHYHNVLTGRCGRGAINRVKKEVEEPSVTAHYVDAKPGEKSFSISNTSWETVTEDEQVPIYSSISSTDYGSTSHTSYRSESVYNYVGNDYVQTGTQSVSETRNIPSYSSDSEETIIGYKTIKVSKRIPVITWREVKIESIRGTIKRIKEVSEEPTDCKCTRQKNC